MRIHGLFVEGVDLGGFSGSTRADDVLGYRFDRRQAVPGEEDLGSLVRESARYRTADRTSRTVNHRHLVLQQHLCSPSVTGVTPAPTPSEAVEDADTESSPDWAPVSRPVRTSRGVRTGWKGGDQR